MAIIYSYPDNYDLLSSDMLVGTSTKMYMGKPKQETKNFTLDALSFFTNHSGYNTLNTVLTNGNTSLVDANVGDLGIWDATALSYAKIKVLSSEFKFYSANYPLNPMVAFDFDSIVFNNMNFTSTISTGSPSANRTYTLPNASGVLALVGDIPDPITLTTIGTSGVATLIGDVLNIPNYSAAVVTPTLDEVLTAGNTSQIDANVGIIGLYDNFNSNYSYIAGDKSRINFYSDPTTRLGWFGDNTIALDNNGFLISIKGPDTLTANRTIKFPDAAGTVALTSDIPVVTTPTLDEVLNEGNTSEVNAYVGGELGLYDVTNTAYSTLNAFDNSFTFNNSAGDPVLYFEQGTLSISKSATIAGTIGVSLLSTSRNYSLPDASGTIALTSDIPSLAGYVQTTRTLTINGTTYDLSANRTWSVGTVTDVTAAGLITSTGGTNPVISTQINTNVLVGRTTAGTGVMEEITIGSGLTLSSGTLSATSTGGGIPHTTAADTDTYTATVASVTSYADGDAYLVRFANGNTTGATLNINGLGAIPLYRNNDGAVIGGDIWDGAEMLCVYNSTTTAFQCIGTSSNSLFAYVTNADSVAITKGQPVYAFGGTGDRLTVKRASCTGDATSAQTVGVVLTSSIGVNQKGIIIIQGLLDGLNILPTSTWADGDPVYLGTTAGSITNVKQYAPNHLVYLGTVTTASNGSSGRWYVRVQNGYELDELHNVQAQSPSLKDTLWYDSGVTPGQWKTASISTILGYTPFNLPSLSSGSVIFSNGTTLAQDNSNFFWDDTNNRLGIGTNLPSRTLHVKSNLSSQIVLEGISGSQEGISSANGGNLAVYQPLTGNWQYGPLSMNPMFNSITYLAQDVFYGNITSDFIPKRATIGFADSLIYDDGTNVGIGTSSPTDPLTVYGDIKFGTATGAVETIRSAAGGSLLSYSPILSTVNIASSNLVIDTVNSVISTPNSVGIGTATPATALDVNGVITATGGNSISWNAKQDAITLTTTGTSGPATLVGSTLNIPQYSGGGGGGNVLATHVLAKPQSGFYYGTGIGAGTTVSNTSNGTLILSAFTPAYELIVSSISLQVTTALVGGLLKVVIYSDLNGVPNTKLFESATAATDTTGTKTITGFSFTFSAGVTYWVSMIANGVVGVRCLNAGSITAAPIIANSSTTQFYQSWFINNSFASPSATLTAPTSGNLNGSAIPYVIFRAT